MRQPPPGNHGKDLILRRHHVKFPSALTLALALGCFPLTYAVAKETPKSSQAVQIVRPAEYSEFLKEKFGITFQPIVGRDEFLAALRTATGLSVESIDPASASDSQFDSMQALSIALKAANMKELAYTYPPEKASKVLGRSRIAKAKLGASSFQELAAAVDSGLLPSRLFPAFDPKAALNKELADQLLGGVLSMRGLYKHYLGFVRDVDIYGKFSDAFRQSAIIQAPELRSVVDTALKRKLVTGYNLKDSRYDPHFIETRTLTYGHSDLDHALQLLGLLRSEGINAKVQFEPKTSAFVYMKEWGDPGQPTENMEVVKIESGDYIEYAKEYDIAFEFDTTKDKDRFQSVIFAYAKKNKKDQPGLLVHSWWQPLFHSRTSLEGYRLITNHFFAKAPYYAQTFALNEKSAGIVDGFKSINPGTSVSTYQFWVDEPFYNYLQGESK